MKTWIKLYWIDAVRVLTAIIAGILLIICINGLSQTLALSKKANVIANQNKELGDQIKSLSEQNKKIGEDNKTLNAQNQAFIKCVASLFATYTQTGRAVYIEDLEKCIIQTNTPQNSVQNGTVQSQTGSGSGQSQNASKGTPSNPNPSPKPSTVQQITKPAVDFYQMVVRGVRGLL